MLDVSDLRAALIQLNLTGELNRNTPEANRQAIREMLGGNDYYAMGAQGLEALGLTYDTAADIVAAAIGMSRQRFESDQPPYIDPDHTTSRLITGLHRLEAAARHHHSVMFATAHPGSMLSFYQALGEYLEIKGARRVRLTQPVAAAENRWLDDVGGVVVLSDEGNLMHTHADQGLAKLIRKLKPALVVADHAFAVAAMNERTPTIAIFDVDDPAIPVLAQAEPDQFLAIPMNDNQTNSRTAQAAGHLIGALSHDPIPRHLHARAAGPA